MKNKRTLEFGLGLAGAILSLVGIIIAIIASVFAFGISNALLTNTNYYYSDYYMTTGDIESAQFVLSITVIIVIVVILLALVGGILSLVGALSVRNKTTVEKVIKEGTTEATTSVNVEPLEK